MSNTVGGRIKDLRLSLGLSQSQLTDLIGYKNRATVTKIENGERKASLDQIRLFAKALHTTEQYLLGIDDAGTSELLSYKFNVVGEVAAGFNFDSNVEDTGEYEYIPKQWLHNQPPENFFVCKVHGDSMYPIYLDCDRLLVRRLPSVPSGSVAVIQYDSDYVTVKQVRYERGQDWLELIPLNREFAPKVIKGVDLERCRVCGEVWKTIRDNK